MVDTKETINTFAKSSLTFEGYITILSGTAPNQLYTRLDQLMELSIDTDMETVSHFNSSKVQHNVVVANNSIGIISIKDTVDIYQKSGAATKKFLLTDMVKELNNNLRVVPITFVGIQKTESTSDPDFIIETIQCDVIAVRKRRNLGTGDYTVDLEVKINSRIPEAADSSPEPA